MRIFESANSTHLTPLYDQYLSLSMKSNMSSGGKTFGTNVEGNFGCPELYLLRATITDNSPRFPGGY
ncbi:MAG: hypothetical protein K2J78_03240, partial [Muribaculaceae bacterium]|nr:hypothetical protein [Muribaculaceae bacterium]